MKYKCWFVFFAGLLIFACNNNSNTPGGFESSSSFVEYSSADVYSSSDISEPPTIVPDNSSSSEDIDDPSSSSNEISSSSEIEILSSSSIGKSSSSTLSSSSKIIVSSSSRIVLSSSSAAVSSSSEAPPEIIKWPTLKKGDAGVKEGWGSRYWDGCKPHCSQRDNVDLKADPFTVCRNCNKNNNEIPAFTLSPNIEVRYDQWANKIMEDWIGYEETKNSCQSGGIAYACWDMAPLELNDNLAYAFMATALKNASCGQCFQLQFDGGGKFGKKQAHELIKGKTLIVMATNTGSDVEDGQFDIMIPGGGPGMYDSFAEQIGVSKDKLGENSGGFLTTCQREINDYDKPAKNFQDCVEKKCKAVFSKVGHEDLLRGCLWFADWYKAADNPTYIYKKVDCPKYFTDKYPSTINKSPDNKIEPYGGFSKKIPDGYETQKWTWK